MAGRGFEREKARRAAAANAAKEAAGKPDTDFDRERRAAMAEHTYLHLGPQIPLGKIPSRRLQSFREDMAGGRPNPQRLVHMASLDIETARALVDEGRKKNAASRSFPEIKRFITRAKQTLGEVVKTQSIPPSVFDLRTELLLSGLDLYQAQFTDISDNELTKVKLNNAKGQVEVVKKALEYLSGRTDEESQQFLHELTTLLVLGPKLSVFSIPSRFWSSRVDQQHHTHLTVVTEQFDFGVRVAQHNPSDSVHVSPEELAHDGYPADHPFGTLQAALGFYEEYIRNANLKTGKIVFPIASGERNNHLQGILKKVEANLIRQLREGNGRSADFIKSPSTRGQAVSWYEYTSPYHQFEAFLPELYDAITLMEAEKKELNQGEIYTLAWMHLELGVREAEDKKASAEDHFKRASDLFQEVENGAENEYDQKRVFYQAQFDRYAVPVYQAVASRDPEIASTITSYTQKLKDLAENILRVTAQPHTISPADANGLDELLGDITVALLATTDADNGHLAVPGTSRQSRQGGWGTTVWVETGNGFRSDYFGRITSPQSDVAQGDPYLVDAGSVTRDVLDGILAEMSGGSQWERRSVVTERKQLVARARASVLAVADSFED